MTEKWKQDLVMEMIDSLGDPGKFEAFGARIKAEIEELERQNPELRKMREDEEGPA